MRRLHLRVEGQVQGVGFRPHVHRLANALGLAGWVQNTAAGVQIEVQGTEVEAFLLALQSQLPSLASIETIESREVGVDQGESSFSILSSLQGAITTKLPPDTVVCDACLVELFDPNSHYYLYPFITCTQCGPRYTLANTLPFDRSATSMQDFPLCAYCSQAFNNPLDRRYHAQAIACRECGPKLTDSVAEMVEAILRGEIVAVKGLGGYQLMCDASNARTLSELRTRKNRKNKPFAVMALNSVSVDSFADVTQEEKALLSSAERPIVLLSKKNTSLPQQIAPKLNSVGVMLPYTPLHYLLFHALMRNPQHSHWLEQPCEHVLVVTSANVSGSPLIREEQKAEAKLVPLADKLVHYNRDIVTRVDDSLTRVVANKSRMIRRARGFVPRSILLPHEIPSTLGLGGLLKNTLCVTRGQEAFLSQHIGDLTNPETIRFYQQTLDHLVKFLGIKPECVAHDLHPQFYSTTIASQFNLPSFAIQHHQAHLAACAAEHGITDSALGLALDGFGLGENSESMGGELLALQGGQYSHLGSLLPLMQPGGDKAVTEPWRMAASVLFQLGRGKEISTRFAKYPKSQHINEVLIKQINCPLTSSCGRVFDAASALLKVCEVSTYEGEAAMALESLVNRPTVLPSGWKIANNQINLLPLFSALLDCSEVEGANLFHGTLAAALVEWVKLNADTRPVKTVLLAGGTFLNKVLTELVLQQLQAAKFKPLFPALCPPNDGGLSLGQAWIGGNKLMENRACA